MFFQALYHSLAVALDEVIVVRSRRGSVWFEGARTDSLRLVGSGCVGQGEEGDEDEDGNQH